MLIAEVINPDSRKRRIKCSSCGISYSPRDYKILYDNKKLVYFKYKKKIYCHECLYAILKEHSQGKKITFLVQVDDYEFKCVFEPDKHIEDGESPFSDLF